jgi:hypothetical protein
MAENPEEEVQIMYCMTFINANTSSHTCGCPEASIVLDDDVRRRVYRTVGSLAWILSGAGSSVRESL